MAAIGDMPVTLRGSGLTSGIGERQCSEILRLPSVRCMRWKKQPAAVQAVLLERAFSVEETRHSRKKNGSDVAGERAAVHKKHGSDVAGERAVVRRELIPLHQLRQGGFADDNALVYRQLFVIRSYEVGADKSTSIREILSLFQEMALNHVQLLGIAGDGFGATHAMNRQGLIWVVTKMQVDVARYPAWPEVIEIDSWVAQAGKNGMRRDWVMRSFQTGEVLARATSTWCMMHATTRRLSRIPDDVRSEIQPSFVNDLSAYLQHECAAPRISKLDEVSAKHVCSQLTSSLADLDMNQHVNNLKYISWILESIPIDHMKTHKLASIVLEYRRECHSTDIVESLTSALSSINGHQSESNELAKSSSGALCEYTHLLRTQDAGQHEILRGRTTWRLRHVTC